MAEQLNISGETKEQKYLELVPQIRGLLSGESDIIANMANMVAALHMTFNWLWIGFYIVRDQQLVLGPFQGPIACTRINYGKGVCGTAWQSGEIQIVPDVELFPGHIACSSLSRSEIVLPAYSQNGDVYAVLDIDSINLAEFDETDAKYLKQILTFLVN